VLESQTGGLGVGTDSDSYSTEALANSTENLNMNGRSLIVLAFARAWGPRAAAGTNGPGLQVPIRCVPSRRSESASGWHPCQWPPTSAQARLAMGPIIRVMITAHVVCTLAHVAALWFERPHAMRPNLNLK
jgi:hypothetical protein